MLPITILIVVDSGPDPVADGGFTWGPSPDDTLFTLHNLVLTLQSENMILVHTAHRSGDSNATFKAPFNFSTTLTDLNAYDEIWLFGYAGTNGGGPSISDDEVRAIAVFMERGGGVLATGDHAGLGSLMCGKIPRVRSMRKWYGAGEPDIPAGAPANWPGSTGDRADTLVQGRDGQWDFDNQSDDLPQVLSFPNGVAHPILSGPAGPINQFPDHMHEGEVLGFNGVSGPGLRTPWKLDDALTFSGQTFVEYPIINGHQELPLVIATGQVQGGHPTFVENTGRPCESQFFNDPSLTTEKQINILAVYDGHVAGVGRIITDSSFHHYLDLNTTGDPCSTGAKVVGFNTSEGASVLEALQSYWVNAAQWLAGPQFSSITGSSPDGNIPTAFFTHGGDPLQHAVSVPTTTNPSGPRSWTIINGLPGRNVQRGSGLTSCGISDTDTRVYYTDTTSRVNQTIWNGTLGSSSAYESMVLPSLEVRSGSSIISIKKTHEVGVYYIDSVNRINELSASTTSKTAAWSNNVLPSHPVRSDSPLTGLTLSNGDQRIYYIDSQNLVNELAWVGRWVNTVLPSDASPGHPAAPYSGVTCFALNGSDSRVYYSGEFNRLSAMNWMGDHWENAELFLPGPAGPITVPQGGAMASFQEGNDAHVIFIEVANTENTTFTNLVEVQPSSQVAGSWQMGGVVDQQARQPSSMCLVKVSSGIKLFFVGQDAKMYVATKVGSTWATEVL
ncbi:hypothetical protein AYL99_04882 [Fonsecaea erecta]|uniref:Fucose-specific lectin n=1 Tax=Fonsecaea erecta TaxID=1367422 RepID=A0A178ZJB0_9EURO|nr:hypothetical protein AYL99_04882 [Fonsecaea erecta]OAP59880.1 hypothetical protein AYL99_04882 [Fonsecaea erecta]